MGRLIEPSALRKLVLYAEDRALEIFTTTSIHTNRGIQVVSIYQDRLILSGYKEISRPDSIFTDTVYMDVRIKFDGDISNLKKRVTDEVLQFYKHEPINGFKRLQFRFFGWHLKESERIYSLDDIIDMCIDAINMKGNNNE